MDDYKPRKKIIRKLNFNYSFTYSKVALLQDFIISVGGSSISCFETAWNLLVSMIVL